MGPYLARIGNPSHISKAEAYLLHEECLNDFKQSSVDKANSILRTIGERASELEKMQASLTQVREVFARQSIIRVFVKVVNNRC